MLTKTFGATLVGVDAKIVEVEVDVSNGLPCFGIVGLVDAAIRESKERIQGCLRNSIYKYPLARMTVNLAPANVYKYGTQLDLAIAIGILVSSGQIKQDFADTVFLGEISMNSEIKPVRGVLAMALAAKQKGFKKICIPRSNVNEALLVPGLEVYVCANLDEAINGKFLTHASGANKISFDNKVEVDFSDIIGQGAAKRGVALAVAGGHNILMSGPPGIGKTILAQAVRSIVPDPDENKLLEIIKIQSAAGVEKKTSVPFRSPHHTISVPAFVGGGIVPRPGEITLAHGGILFLDELPEFSKTVLENLREPLENKRVTVTRALGSFAFPADFILIAAQNPCPCGFFGDEQKTCICTPGQIQSYSRKISGAILDRIDIQIRMSRENPGSRQPAESSSDLRTKVSKARNFQIARQDKLNSLLTRKEIEKHCLLERESRDLLESAREHSHFSLRSYFKVLKVARTIADFAQSSNIRAEHIAEALAYKMVKV